MVPTRVPATEPYYKDADLALAALAVGLGRFERGPKVSELEERFADYQGSAAACALPAARMGLYYLLRALDLEEGAEVLTTPITIADMINMIRGAGLTPKMVDMDESTLGFDLESLRANITPRSRVLLVTYLYGIVPANLDEVLDLAERHGLIVVEDVSQALGAELRGRKLGSLGHAAICSLSTFKICCSLFGGLAASADRELVSRAAALARSEMRPPKRARFAPLLVKILAYRAATADPLYPLLTFPFFHMLSRLGPDLSDRVRSGNLRTALAMVPHTYGAPDPALLQHYTDFQAEMGLRSLARVDAVNESLRGQAAELASDAEIERRLPRSHTEGRSVYWRFPVRSDDAAALARRLAARGLETSRNALPVCSELPGLKDFAAGDLDGARRVHEDYLLAPLHAWSSRARVAAVREALSAALRE